MISRSAVKKFIKEKKFRTSVEALDTLETTLRDIIEVAIVRAKEDKRKTIQAIDIQIKRM